MTYTIEHLIERGPELAVERSRKIVVKRGNVFLDGFQVCAARSQLAAFQWVCANLSSPCDRWEII